MRSRLAGFAVLGIACVALLGWVLGNWILAQPFTEAERHLGPVLLLSPLMISCIVGVGTSSPFGDSENTSGFPLPMLRFGHLAALLVWSLLTLTLTMITWSSDYAGWVLVRNLFGFTGLALIGAGLLGSHLSWVVPFTFYAIVVFVGRSETLDGDGSGVFAKILGEVPVGEWERWAWPMRPDTDLLSWVCAFGLIVLGLAHASIFGARRSSEMGDPPKIRELWW